MRSGMKEAGRPLAALLSPAAPLIQSKGEPIDGGSQSENDPAPWRPIEERHWGEAARLANANRLVPFFSVRRQKTR